MNNLERIGESVWNTYRSIAYCLIEEAPEGWREWPLDPKDASKGTLQAQKQKEQEGVKGGRKKPGEPWTAIGKRRVRINQPASDLGVKGTRTTHVTGGAGVDRYNVAARRKGPSGTPYVSHERQSGRYNQPEGVTRRTSVKGKTKEGKQINVRDFPYRPRGT